jgi:RNA polymerase sigma-70 factor (ECF subfamily)
MEMRAQRRCSSARTAHVCSAWRPACSARGTGRSTTWFIAALEGASRFDGRSALSTWLVGIANRRALDAARSRARRQRLREVTSWFGFGEAAPAASAAHDARDASTRALAALTPEQRSVFVLVDVEGYTLQEVADMTGTGISTLHARLAAARKRLDLLGGGDAEGVR